MGSLTDIHNEMNSLKAMCLHNNNGYTFLEKQKDKVRPIVKKEVDSFLHCGDLSDGFCTIKCEA
ncbi:hypothetical protein GCM10008936_00110 [Alkalibacterium indicireducens]|uniref:Uncharacterized protein n=1 Tax=Alkalibacterium indicireducens TaxID=398758 RepID=A0ABN1ACN2_9LACT